MSDRDVKNWDQRLGDQSKRDWDNYLRRRIYLDEPRINGLMAVAGEYLYVEKVSASVASASVRINRNTNDDISLVVGTRIETVFKELYITNTAQAGEWIDLIIGINFKYYRPYGDVTEQARARAVVPLTHQNANTNVTPAAQICDAVLIKANVLNTGIAWINFGVAAVQNACLPLNPGESVTVHLSNLNQINANFAVGGEYVFIVYEV